MFLYAIIFLLLLGALMLWREPLAGVAWRALAPIAGAREGVTASGGGIFSAFSSKASLAAEVAALKEQLASSSIELADRDLLYAENLQLKERLGRHASSTRSLLATVIMRPPGTPYDTLMLDVGTDDGVAVGDLVSAGGSVYIGKISQAYPSASRATLFSAPGESHDALLLTASSSVSVPFSLSGQGGASFTGEVPAGTAVEPGDSVLLPNLGVQFVAKVTAVDSSAERSFKTVYLELPVNPLSLRFVEVRNAASAASTYAQ